MEVGRRVGFWTEKRTSELVCNDSIMSCDTLAGEDLSIGTCQRQHLCVYSSQQWLLLKSEPTDPFHTCVGAEPDGFDEFAPMFPLSLFSFLP